MALHEDAASVLEQFVQDVANLPAEIVHLLEEIEAKDKVAQEHRSQILSRDSSIQRHLKASGCSAAYPKEEGYCKKVAIHFDEASVLQNEKVALSDKAALLLDRQLKRLDVQIKALESAGVLVADGILPSILAPGSGRLSASSTGVSTPLNATSGNAGTLGSSTMTNAAVARLIGSVQGTPGRRDTVSTATATPTANTTTANPSRSTREGSTETKKRRLANEPKQSSGLRQSSLGPASTPKAATPSGQSRAGSAGPRSNTLSKANKTIAGPKRAGSSLNPASAAKKGTGSRKGRKGVRGLKISPSDGDDSALSEVGDSENERGSQLRNSMTNDGAGDVEMGGMEEEDEEEADGDNRKYCTCRSVSYGNMIACDNDDCEYEWFHWGCVGMTKEPAGKWYCEACKVKLGIK